MIEFFQVTVMVATLAWVLSSEEVARPLREWTQKRGTRSKLFEWLGKGIACLFCAGGWFSVLGVFYLPQPDFFSYFQTYFLLVGSSALVTTTYATYRQIYKWLYYQASTAQTLHRRAQALMRDASNHPTAPDENASTKQRLAFLRQ